ncbi:MAG: hypothetical protein ACFFHV_21415 [Promethearchaeota archaeon]
MKYELDHSLTYLVQKKFTYKHNSFFMKEIYTGCLSILGKEMLSLKMLIIYVTCLPNIGLVVKFGSRSPTHIEETEDVRKKLKDPNTRKTDASSQGKAVS